MAQIKVAGNIYVVESKFTKKELETVQKYRPNLLKLFDEDKRPVFAVGFGDRAEIGALGVQFNEVTRGEKPVACLTMPLPKGEGTAKDLVVEAVGVAILHLNEVEENIAVALEEIKAEKEAVAETVAVL